MAIFEWIQPMHACWSSSCCWIFFLI
jgi:hypothetical protein